MSIRVGFIGLGNQGKPIAAHLAPAGFETMVYDVAPEPVEALVQGGALGGLEQPARVLPHHDDGGPIGIEGLTNAGLERVHRRGRRGRLARAGVLRPAESLSGAPRAPAASQIQRRPLSGPFRRLIARDTLRRHECRRHER